jgi:hypothetical protein
MEGNPRMNDMRWRLATLILVLIIPLAGLSFGEEQSVPIPGVGPEESRPGPSESSAASGQIDPGSELAAKINRKGMVRILYSSGKITCRKPIILTDGIASRMTNSGEEMIRGGYNQSTFIRWSDVRAIQRRKSYAGFGALAGYLAGLAVASSSSGVMSGVIVLGPVSGLVGVIVGSMIKRWKTIYSAPGDTRSIPNISLMPTRRGGVAVSFSLSF